MAIGQRGELQRAVDAFMAKPKALVLPDAPVVWNQGRNRFEKRLKLPLEIDGEQLGQFLWLTYYPDHPTPNFHIGIQFLDYVVCRLDFEMESVHANKTQRYAHGLPPLVRGPHWHSWELNKDSFFFLGQLLKLPYAEPFTQARKFDAALRWYCGERHIHLGHYNIEPPPREWLL